MKIFLLVLCLVVAGFMAVSTTSHNKPAATVAAQAIAPLAGQLSGLVSGSTNDYLAGMPGAIGDSARRNQRTSAAVVAQRERVTRRPMADCVKPGPLIDLDVKECMDGTRVKDW
jgi:hypothetical protein